MDLPRWLLFVKRYLPEWEEANNFDLWPNGRVGVIWNPKRDSLRSVGRHPQVLTFEVFSLSFGFQFAMSAVFGFYSVQDRIPLLNESAVFSSSWNGPWMIAGDFNCILFANERIGRQVGSREIRDFRSFSDDVGMIDCPSTGCFYTFLRANMRSRIDRVLLNGLWGGSPFNPVVDFSPSGNFSDHCLGLIKLGQATSTTGRFHFSNMWVKHPDFLETVREH